MIALDCTGKRALVCGSTQGIGKAIALRLAEAGSSVTLAARNEHALQEVAVSLPIFDRTQQHDYIVADFSDAAALRMAVARYLEHHSPFHILINNTGGPPPGAISQADSSAFLAALSQHLLCNHHLVQLLLPGMKEAQYGRIINIISTSVKQPIPNLGVSNTTRGAVASWAKTLSFELAEFGITVNNILPGYITTARLDAVIHSMAQAQSLSAEEAARRMKESIPAGRFGTPEEVANLAVFLASPLASYINGTSIPVDGGRTTAF
ncbi:MAG: SDR family oxidoreductase [Bacteroidota bacterium]|nr:SDR family oxidoreductase [Candidatus Kapabacteria bacterium]MDW8219010.1 SDR family oxidoreductase [Bacteroidota bacterium]